MKKLKLTLMTALSAFILFLTGCNMANSNAALYNDSNSRIKLCEEKYGGIARRSYTVTGTPYAGCDFPVRVLIIDPSGQQVLEQPKLSPRQ